MALTCALLAVLIVSVVYGFLLMRAAAQAVSALPAGVSAELQATQSQLLAEVAATRKDLTAQIEGARKETLGVVDRQLTAVQLNALSAIREQGTQLNGQVTAALSIADRRLGDTLARTDAALGTVDALRKDAKPAIDGAVALESDAKDSWDDMYWDVKALVGSATVAARGVAETSEAVGKAAPRLADSAIGIGKNADGIAADVHQATTDFVKPKTFGQKFRSWLETAGKIAARFL